MYEPKELKSGSFSISAWVTEVNKSGINILAAALIEKQKVE